MVAVMSVAPVRLTEHGHGLALVGLIVSVHVAGMFMPSPISGWLADRRGPVVVATIGFALLVTAGLAGALVNLHRGWDHARARRAGHRLELRIVGGSTLLTASTTPRLRPHAEGIGEVTMGIAAGLGAPIAAC
jgi:MFS family permease